MRYDTNHKMRVGAVARAIENNQLSMVIAITHKSIWEK